MSTPTAAELREALAGTSDEFFYPREQVILDAARLLADILEQGEEMDWCEVHGSSKKPRNGVCDYTVGMTFRSPCRFVSQLRIPSAVLDPAKNEEEDET